MECIRADEGREEGTDRESFANARGWIVEEGGKHEKRAEDSFSA